MSGLSIVVVAWNTRGLLMDCLASIELAVDAMTEPRRVVETCVVDNGSTDGTAEAVRARFPWARLIALPCNVGFAAGCNAGIRETREACVLLLNSDAQLHAGTLDHCIAYLEAHPDVGLVGPQLLHPDGAAQNSIHNYPGIASELIPKSVLQFVFRERYPSRRWVGAAPRDVEALVGAALFARRAMIDRVGSLSDEYFFFFEETDWCWRIRAAGWRIVFLPDAHVTHLSGGSSKRKNATLTRIEYHRSLYRFYRKHRGIGWMAIVLALRLTKCVFYVVTQAPLAPLGGRWRERWTMHRDVLLWHLRGCPGSVGFAQPSAETAARNAAAG